MTKPEWFYLWKGSRPLEQGIIIPNFSFPKLEDLPRAGKDAKKEVGFEEFDAIILSQSCDLTGKDIESIQICPVDSLNELMNSDPDMLKATSESKKVKARKKLFTNYQQGRYASQHMLNMLTVYKLRQMRAELPGEKIDDSLKKFAGQRLVASFKDSRIVPRSYLLSFIDKSSYYLAVSPPYREALSQKFGLYFMRVGNPINYKKFNDREFIMNSDEEVLPQ